MCSRNPASFDSYLLPDEEGDRACNGGVDILNRDPLFKDYVPFYEYFDGDSGRGLGASHQTGWTSLVTKWIHDNAASNRVPRTPQTPKNRRRQSVFLHASEEANDDDEEELQKYVPKCGPMPGTLARRKSGKSLLNLTVNALDLGTKKEVQLQKLLCVVKSVKEINQ